MTFQPLWWMHPNCSSFFADLLSENDSILDPYSDEFPGPIWQCLNSCWLDNGAQPNDLPALTAMHLTHTKKWTNEYTIPLSGMFCVCTFNLWITLFKFLRFSRRQQDQWRVAWWGWATAMEEILAVVLFANTLHHIKLQIDYNIFGHWSTFYYFFVVSMAG